MCGFGSDLRLRCIAAQKILENTAQEEYRVEWDKKPAPDTIKSRVRFPSEINYCKNSFFEKNIIKFEQKETLPTRLNPLNKVSSLPISFQRVF